MLYIFLVDTGNMIQLDMNLALETVGYLKGVIARLTMFFLDLLAPCRLKKLHLSTDRSRTPSCEIKIYMSDLSQTI